MYTYLLIDVPMDGARDGKGDHPQHKEGKLPPDAVERREEHEVEWGAEDVAMHLFFFFFKLNL